MNRKLISRIINIISLMLLLIIVISLIYSTGSGSNDLLYIFTPLLIVMVIFSIVSRILSNKKFFDENDDFDEKYAEKTIFSQKQTQSIKKDTLKNTVDDSSKIDISKKELLESKNALYKTMIDSELGEFIDDLDNKESKPGERKYTHHCPKCNALISNEDKKCPECGEPVERVVKCNYCGHKNAKGTIVCEKCGNILY